jgi:hypothetical protein
MMVMKKVGSVVNDREQLMTQQSQAYLSAMAGGLPFSVVTQSD